MDALLVLFLSASVVYATPAGGVQDIAVSSPVCNGTHGWTYGIYFGISVSTVTIEEEYFLSGAA